MATTNFPDGAGYTAPTSSEADQWRGYPMLDQVHLDDSTFANDPYDTIQQLRRSTEHGGVKIVPPQSWKLSFREEMLDRIPIVTVAQSLSTHNDETRMEFYRTLAQCYTSGRFPTIDKKAIDLYNLWKLVNERGGFDLVCRQKQWAQIGRELGYTRTMTSLSTSLKAAYLKVLSPYDATLKRADQGETSTGEPSDLKNETNKRPMETHDDPCKRKQEPGSDFYLRLSNSSPTRLSPVDILKSKGLRTNFESWTQEKMGITTRDPATYPHYDFYYWHRGKEVLDSPVSELETIGDAKTFAEFCKESVTTSTSDEEYWDKFHTKTLESINIPVYSLPYHISLFPQLEMASEKQDLKSSVFHPWNLNNMALNKNNLLCYLPNELENLTTPRISLGSHYKVVNFSLQDHDGYLCEYHHWGAPKVWYFIDPSDKDKYEQLLQKLSKVSNSHSFDLSGIEVSEGLKQDLIDCLNEGGEFDNGPQITECSWNFKRNLRPFDPNLVLSPKFLKENGITCHCQVSNPGEFIVKFPKSYAMSISLGPNVTESVPIFPKDWINIADHVRYPLTNTVPSFSFFQLLTNIVEESKDPELLRIVSPHLDSLIDEEMAIRANYKSEMKLITNKFDYISDDSLSSTFPTKVVVKAPNSMPIIFDSRSPIPKEVVNPHGMKLELHVYYTDEKLRTIQRTMLALSQTPEEWVEKFNNLLLSDSKPPLKSLKALYSESEQVLRDIPQAETLREYLEDADKWVDKAQLILNAKQKNRIRNRKGTKTEDSDFKIQYDLQDLRSLVVSISDLSFTCPEIEQILELANEISTYEASVRSLLLTEGSSIEQFKDMIDLGKSFGVRLDSIALLERILLRLGWLQRYEASSKGQSLEELESLLDEGYDVCGVSDNLKVKYLENRVNNGRQWCQRALVELNNPSTSYEQINVLLKSLDHVPLYQEVVDKLELVKQTRNDYQDKLENLFKVLKDNETLLGNLRDEKLKKSRGDPTFNVQVYNELLNTFNGSSSDPRPLYSSSKDIIDRAKEFQPSERLLTFDSPLKQAEDWWRSMKKLFGKINSPFAMMKQHLSDLRDKNSIALSLEDKYHSNLKEEDHSIYCVCRRAESGVMIACEHCQEWYHCKCLKFGRGKSKEVENYICPICDYHVPVPREFNCPKLEDVEEVVNLGSFGDLNPDQLDVLSDIANDGLKFRSFLHEAFTWEDGLIVNETDVAKVRFYLRKLEGASVLLLDEYNQLRQLTWALDPFCDGPPPNIDCSNKTQRRKPKSNMNSVNVSTANTSVGSEENASTSNVASTNGLPLQLLAASSLDNVGGTDGVQGARSVELSKTGGMSSNEVAPSEMATEEKAEVANATQADTNATKTETNATKSETNATKSETTNATEKAETNATQAEHNPQPNSEATAPQPSAKTD
ncbi:unnamed protein product [Cyberlindnera jadinii]|uniref:PLU-1-domain-containing protein n=1 Tax=Cyberlindnera jadinii (strain ATCC 18201 / CBS 1600 / BCRC 20928 / JCM 3617 / NBRC 0987 / NRRL Y-1542) TaxID=983966 RepID=A0A0H5C861_CYBJN|nr:unnamed protein product [Cyberlindnera jadinii]